MTKEDRRYRDRFDPSVDVNMLENPLIPRQSENAAWLLDQRYLLSRYDRAEGKVRKEASFEEFARRVSRVIASVETLYVNEEGLNWIRVLEKNLFSDILNRRFLFNSPCLFGAAAGMTVDPAMSELIYRSPDDMSYSDYVAVRDGKTESQQLFACFVISVEDSIEGIFDSVKDAAVISKYGGGVGGNFGNLREFGSDIKGGTGGKASGPVSFMETWNTMGSVVVQGGRRRAALMGMLYDDHPDVERFMDAKVEDGKLPYFNISVSVSDELLTKAAQGGDFNLRSRADGSVAKTVKAADLWDKLCRNAWRRGDPGVFFGDRANVDNILKKDPQWRIESTNPCVTGDTWVMTDEGPQQAVNLVGRPTTLLVDGKGHETEGFFSTGVKPVFELKTKEGHSLKLTVDHKVRRVIYKSRDRMDFEWIPASDLSESDLLVLNNHRDFIGWNGRYTESEGYLMGLLLGDGTIKNGKAVLSVWMPEKASNDDSVGQDAVMNKALSCALKLKHRSDFAGWTSVSGRDEFRLSTSAIKQLATDLGMSVGNKMISPTLEGETSSSFYSGFLRGLFDSDGSVQGSQEKGLSVRLAQSNLHTLQSVQRMLARLGIVSKIYKYRRKANLRSMPDGKGGSRLYQIQDQHELVISNDNLSRFQARVGFEDSDKSLKLENAINSYDRRQNRERFIARFDSLVACGEEAVFDVQVPGVNAFDANGLYVHNCGEQPLPNYTSCNLGSVNLEAFVSSESSGEAVFDMDSFVDQVFRSVYYLDLVIDATSYPLERIADRTKMIRPVGLGLMGLADAAIMLGISYGSESFNRFCRSLGGTMASAALAATVRIVSEEGKDPFPEHRLVSDLMESFRCEAGLPDAVDRWLERMDEGGFRELLERMRRTDTVPYTLVNTLEVLLSAASVHKGDGMGLVREVLEALFSGRMRNSRRLSVAPTGSISMLLDASPGIEPNFAWSWSRKVMSATGDGGYETREYFHRLMTAEHKDEFRRTGGISDPRFVTAYDIGTDSHVEVTGIFAAVVDSGISKTVNLPSEATVDDVRQVYEDCYRMGCKGITIYRDGSRSDQPIEAKKSDEPEKRPLSSKVKERPGSIVFGKTIKDVTPWGSMYVTINYDSDDPFEVFASLGKSGSEMKSMTEALSRVISIGLRSGGRLEDFISTLRGISGKEYWLFECDDDRVVRSIPDGIAILMEKLSGLGGETLKDVPKCPECGSPMEMVGGCEYCFSCGYSPCK
ncbi:ribonucleoside-diphosphate reductase [Dethiosulfovibrio sp. F2B]|uniref:LAGLIDADG family homing endonuclease n=1 Tax=Dethiosulfovibrio faecalis TaxID=2720018 RepID=UPI001F41E983|nr:LAGLIDADG family homing endonuclease [Dethiosulfovibrio faecalis]MCF4152413.1 ribonucleoside-diphosphate reductase [Dethiosulfovibrio faecalis]